MMRRIIVILTALLAVFPLAAQNLESIDCDFVQTKSSALLAEAAVSKGHMTFNQPDCLRWEYVSPMSFAFIMNGQDFSIERNGKVQTLDANQNKAIKQMVGLVLSTMDGSALKDETLFRTEISDDGKTRMAVLYPLKRDIKKMWSKLVLCFENGSPCASRFEMHETSGDVTIIEFKNCKYAVAQ